ncbi:hypothetical protein [Roseivirga pacifica]|uniref:hypothetical protein n=1 Tax=Roseivirga pacifica TaxID=1267423 RepID=UPI003BAE2A5E
MKAEVLITRQVADSIVKVCFDTVEFSRLYEQDQSVQRIFRCNEDIKKGLKWFIGSKNPHEMHCNVGAYLQATESTLKIYSSLNLSFPNKEKLIITLKNLRANLIELQGQVERR